MGDLIEIYDPLSAPVKSLASFKSLLSSPPGSGIFPAISNLRWGDDGILTTRLGTSQKTSAPVQTSDTGTSSGSNTDATLKDTTKTWTAGAFVGAGVVITGGTGAGQTSFVTANTTTQLTVSPVWPVVPDSTSTYSICAEPRGLRALTFQGVQGTIALAAKDWASHKTSIYLSSDPTDFGTTITPSSGKYGDCRLSADSNGNDYPTSFAVLNDRASGLDVLVMQNGYDNPRVYDGTNCAPVLAISPQTFTSGCCSQSGMSGFFNVAGGQFSGGSLTRSIATIALASSGFSHATPCVLTTASAHGMVDGQPFWLHIAEIPQVNSYFFAKVTGHTSTTLAVYKDAALTIPYTDGYTNPSASGFISPGAIYWDWDYNESVGGSALQIQTFTTTMSLISGAIGFTAGTAMSWGNANPLQLILTVQGATTAMITDFLSMFKISAVYTGGGGGTVDLYDPTANNYQSSLTYTGTLGNQPYIAGDSSAIVNHICLAMDPIYAAGGTAITEVILTPLTYCGYVPSGELNFNIAGISVGGNWKGGTQYSVAYEHSVSRVESFSQVLPIRSARLQDSGMAVGIVSNALWPIVDSIRYQPILYYLPLGSDDIANGVDTATFYAEELGESVFTYIASQTISTYSSGWTQTSPTNGLLSYTIEGATTPPNSRLLWRPSPSDYIEPIQIGKSMTVGASSRLLVGARSSSQDAFPRAVIGEGGDGLCFRFASAPDLTDPYTGYEDSIPGESIQAMVPSAASTFAAPTMYALTDGSLFLVSVNDIGTAAYLRRVATIGCVAPGSVAEHRGSVFYFDTDYRIQNIGGYRVAPISLGIIDDKLTTIPTSRAFRAMGWYFKDRFYMGRTPAGSTRNTNIVIFHVLAGSWEGGYSTVNGAWESDDVLPFPMSAEFVTIQRSGAGPAYGSIAAPITLMLSQDMNVYEYESGTTDLSEPVTWNLATGWQQGQEEHEEQKTFQFGRLHMLVDNVTGNPVVTGTYQYLPDDCTASVELTLESGTNPFDWVKSPAPVPSLSPASRGFGVAGSIALTSAFPGGTRIHGLMVEVIPNDLGPRMSV